VRCIHFVLKIFSESGDYSCTFFRKFLHYIITQHACRRHLDLSQTLSDSLTSYFGIPHAHGPCLGTSVCLPDCHPPERSHHSLTQRPSNASLSANPPVHLRPTFHPGMIPASRGTARASLGAHGSFIHSFIHAGRATIGLAAGSVPAKCASRSFSRPWKSGLAAGGSG